MEPTAEEFGKLKEIAKDKSIHPPGHWEKPDPSDCHWPGDRPVEPKAVGNSSRRSFWIRHDVDDDIGIAWEMALEERARGRKSVYFFLNTASYFRWAVFLQMARDFAAIGHTIGFHNNSVTAAYKMNDPKLAEKILLRDLGYLRQAGDVFITASHGDAWNRHHNVLNYEMFTECRRKGVFPHKPLGHYGLKFEAYYTPYTFYLGDSGGKWSGFDDAGKRYTDPVELVKQFNTRKTGIMQLLIHPQWWKPKPKEEIAK
jgi:hypothetical protein